MLITPDQIRAARALKNWSQTDLAERTGLAVPTIANIEAGKQSPGKNTIEKIRDAFDRDGIEFIGERGVQKKMQEILTYSGTEGFKAFLDDLYNTVLIDQREVCLFNARPENWKKWLDAYWDDVHEPRMADIKPSLSYRITSKEGDTNFISSKFAEYKWVPAAFFNEQAAFYVYADKVAVLDFQDQSVSITTIKQEQFAKVMRILFNSAWDSLGIKPKTKKAGK